MSKHPIDHDRNRDDARVAKQYARIEREQADDLTRSQSQDDVPGRPRCPLACISEDRPRTG